MSFGFPLQLSSSFADPYAVTTFLSRRRPATKPRRRILSVSNYWRCEGPVPLREVLVLDYDGQRRRVYLPDEHPALVSYFERLSYLAGVAA